jgi:site-specific recombinase XerC
LNPVSAIDTWRDWTGLEAGPLLPVVPLGQPGRPLSTDAMVERLQRLAARAGSSVRPTGETLRRSWATHAYEAGLDLLSINRRLRRTVASIGGCNEPVMMAGDKTKQPTDGDLQDGRCAAVA